jgi:hypothetical protein
VRPDFSICEPAAGVSLLAGAAADTLAARGGAGAREPDLGQPHEDLPASAKGRAGSDFAVTVTVYFSRDRRRKERPSRQPDRRPDPVLNGVNENTMKQTLRQGGPDALNVYSATAGAYLGWARPPEIVTEPGQVHLDGVVIDWESLRRVSDTYEGQYDQGERRRTRSATG